ncbi:MAG: hypothetical protein AVDCRST_MAG49-4396, partial [uncultured Thermomicrobiales bacterium]
ANAVPRFGQRREPHRGRCRGDRRWSARRRARSVVTGV